MGAPMELRTARAADASAVSALHVESWRDAYAGMVDAAFLDDAIEPAVAAHWQDALRGRKRPGLVLVALTGWQMQGFFAGRVEGKVGHVDSLHVRPAMRGEGIGRALLGLGAQRLRQQGAASAELWVFAANRDAIRFYARLGGEAGPPGPRASFGQELVQRRIAWPRIDALIAACTG